MDMIGAPKPNTGKAQEKVYLWAKTALKNVDKFDDDQEKLVYLDRTMEDIIEYSGGKDMGLYMDIKKLHKRAGDSKWNRKAEYMAAMTAVAGMTGPSVATAAEVIGGLFKAN